MLRFIWIHEQHNIKRMKQLVQLLLLLLLLLYCTHACNHYKHFCPGVEKKKKQVKLFAGEFEYNRSVDKHEREVRIDIS